MNDSIIHELERLVEQTVRPVRTHFAGKKRMREDLFSHLSATFDDELAKSGDETTALKSTRERFGDPAEVGRELKGSVSFSDKYSYWFERLLAQQPGETFLQQVAKHQFAALLEFTPITVLSFACGFDRGSPGFMLWVFGTLMIVAAFTGSLMLWLTDRMGRARAMQKSDPRQSRRLKWKYGLLSLLVFPGFLLLIYLGFGLAPGIESFTPSRAAWITALAIAPLGPFTVYLMGPKSAERTLYQEKWAALDVTAE